MSINYTGQGYGFGGGPNVQQIRESIPLDSSSFKYSPSIAGERQVVPDASSTAFDGVSHPNAFLLLWGFIGGSSSNSTAFMGSLYDTSISRTAGEVNSDDLGILTATRKGPFMVSFSQPVKVSVGAGIGLDVLTSSSNDDLLTVFFSWSAGGS